MSYCRVWQYSIFIKHQYQHLILWQKFLICWNITLCSNWICRETFYHKKTKPIPFYFNIIYFLISSAFAMFLLSVLTSKLSTYAPQKFDRTAKYFTVSRHTAQVFDLDLHLFSQSLWNMCPHWTTQTVEPMYSKHMGHFFFFITSRLSRLCFLENTERVASVHFSLSNEYFTKDFCFPKRTWLIDCRSISSFIGCFSISIWSSLHRFWFDKYIIFQIKTCIFVKIL